MLRKLLDRPIAVTMIAVVLLILGIVSSRLLPVSLVPDVDAPYITVQIPAQGLSARQLDETVITPLRQQLIQLSQLTDLRSEAREGNGIIRLTFEQGSDIDYLFIEVNEKIDRSTTSLPRDVERPKVIKASVTDIPAFYINLTVRGSTGRAPGRTASRIRPVRGAEPFCLAGHHQAHRAVARGSHGRPERHRCPGTAGYPRRGETPPGGHHHGRRRGGAAPGERDAGEPCHPGRGIPVQREIPVGDKRPEGYRGYFSENQRPVVPPQRTGHDRRAPPQTAGHGIFGRPQRRVAGGRQAGGCPHVEAQGRARQATPAVPLRLSGRGVHRHARPDRTARLLDLEPGEQHHHGGIARLRRHPLFHARHEVADAGDPDHSRDADHLDPGFLPVAYLDQHHLPVGTGAGHRYDGRQFDHRHRQHHGPLDTRGAAGRCRHAGHQGSHGSHAVVRADDLRGIRPADLPQRHGRARCSTTRPWP